MRGRLRLAVSALALVAGLGVAGCGERPSSMALVTASTPATTVATPSGPNGTAAASGATSEDQAVDQQIQGLGNSLNQVSGDLANADKAAANGG